MSDERPGTGSTGDPEPDWSDEPALLEEVGGALGHDPTEVPPPDRVAAIRAAAVARQRQVAEAEQGAGVTELRSPSRRRAFITGSIAAGVAGVAGYLAGDLRSPEPTARAVPVEQITFAGDAEVSTSALINHTWGTELLLDVAGLRAGLAYDVVYDTDGGEVGAGSLLAVPDVVMKCRFNAAPMRSVVHAIEVRSPTGESVLRAELPDAT